MADETLFFRPFNPCGPTTLITASTTAPTAVQIPTIGTDPRNQYRIYNSGTAAVFVSFDVDATTALADCVIPTGSGASAKYSYPLPPGAVEVFTFLPNAFVTGISASATQVIYVTPGQGL